MTESSNNRNYTVADIERYHAGKMSALEMHALEKAAMEDPFLADALEGYTMTPTPQQDLQKIREKLFGEKKEEKTVPFIRKNIYWLRIAAILILIAGGTWLAFNISGSEKSNKVAEQTKINEQPLAKDTTRGFDVAISPARQMADSLDSVAVATTYKGLTSTTATIKTSTSFGRFLQDSASTNGTVAFDTYSYSITPSAPAAMIVDSLNYKSSIQLPDSSVKYRTNTDAVFDKTVTYNATSNANMTAMNGATKMTLPTYNNNNNFYSKRKDNVAEESLSKKEKVAPATNDTIKDLEIVLQPDNKDVQEVVVSAGKKPVAERKMEIKVDTLEPEEGWKKFDDYIARNIQVPEELKSKQTLSGEVQLSFDVNSNGEPVNIKVTKSLCEKCDEEAIRLLKEGPKWKKKKSKKGKVTIVF